MHVIDVFAAFYICEKILLAKNRENDTLANKRRFTVYYFSHHILVLSWKHIYELVCLISSIDAMISDQWLDNCTPCQRSCGGACWFHHGCLSVHLWLSGFCAITPLPFDIVLQWWYFTHLLTITGGRPRLILGCSLCIICNVIYTLLHVCFSSCKFQTKNVIQYTCTCIISDNYAPAIKWQGGINYAPATKWQGGIKCLLCHAVP